MKGVNDSILVKSYIKGDNQAFNPLSEKYKQKIFTTISMIIKDADIAKDLVQDTFIKAINTIQLGRYDEKGKFLPWITRIAHNIAIDYFRRQQKYATVSVEESHFGNLAEYSQDSFEEIQIKKETLKKIKNLIDRLPENQREVLIMRHYKQMCFQEIAEATNVSINTALGRMRYALINLKKQMGKYNEQYICLN